MPSGNLTFRFEGRSGTHWLVTVGPDDIGYAEQRNPGGGSSFAKSQQAALTRTPLAFRPGLWADLNGQPHRFSRVIHDTAWAGVDLPAVLS